MVKLDLHYVDPRLVELYDSANPCGPDTDFYRQLADDINAQTIVDLGCGTGIQTRELATGARQVIGVDPAAAMLAIARRNDTGQRVQWLEGDSRKLGTPNADLLVMTSNVAQVFLDDAEWAETLTAIHKALRPGGYLAFESRNPQARSWEKWNRAATHGVSDTPFGPVEEWLEVVDVKRGRVHFKAYNIFKETGETLVADSILRFRTVDELTDSLMEAGFAIESLYGDWDRGPLVSASPLMVIVASAI